MRIVLNGVETNNKGAELMLYAILQEIERKFPNAEVFLPSFNVAQGHSYVDTKVDFKPYPLDSLFSSLNKYHLSGILRRLKLPWVQFTDFRNIKNVDYFIDGSGFSFSDKWKPSKLTYDMWKYRLEKFEKQGTKIIFLPQAFGPIEREWTKKLVNLLSDKASIIYPREQKSYDYLVNAGVDKNKIKIFTDFTSLVEGVTPKQYSHLADQVCIIPNLRMVDKGTMTMEAYMDLMRAIIKEIRRSGYNAYLLNHEGEGDESLCYAIQKEIGNIEVVTRLNALEVKGLISTAYMCITSRFHGLASALNSCVPCLATSWSHKYEELYKDYGVTDCILDLKDIESIKKKINWILDPKVNEEMRAHLKEVKHKIQAQTREMWDEIWSL